MSQESSTSVGVAETAVVRHYWIQEDLDEVLEHVRLITQAELQRLSLRVPGLLMPDTGKINTDFYHLVFNLKNGTTALTSKMLNILVGTNWKECQKAYRKDLFIVLDKDDKAQIDLSDVPPRYSMSHFNVLSKGRGIKVPAIVGCGNVECDPIVVLAIGLSTSCSRNARGMVVWQRKDRSGSAHKSWLQVPDLLYHDCIWLAEEQERFASLGYAERRDYLCANTRLSPTDVALPFLLHFPGTTLESGDDAYFPIHANPQISPMAMISIPGFAYIGWRPERFNQETYPPGEEALTDAEKEETRVHSMREMYLKIVAMYEERRAGSFVIYAEVREVAMFARASMARMVT